MYHLGCRNRAVEFPPIALVGPSIGGDALSWCPMSRSGRVRGVGGLSGRISGLPVQILLIVAMIFPFPLEKFMSDSVLEER